MSNGLVYALTPAAILLLRLPALHGWSGLTTSGGGKSLMAAVSYSRIEKSDFEKQRSCTAFPWRDHRGELMVLVEADGCGKAPLLACSRPGWTTTDGSIAIDGRG